MNSERKNTRKEGSEVDSSDPNWPRNLSVSDGIVANAVAVFRGRNREEQSRIYDSISIDVDLLCTFGDDIFRVRRIIKMPRLVDQNLRFERYLDKCSMFLFFLNYNFASLLLTEILKQQMMQK